MRFDDRFHNSRASDYSYFIDTFVRCLLTLNRRGTNRSRSVSIRSRCRSLSDTAFRALRLCELPFTRSRLEIKRTLSLSVRFKLHLDQVKEGEEGREKGYITRDLAVPLGIRTCDLKVIEVVNFTIEDILQIRRNDSKF